MTGFRSLGWARVSGPRAGEGAQATLESRLRADGAVYDDAVRELHALMLRAAWHQAGQMREMCALLGSRRVEGAVTAAADEATMAVLSRLDAFEGRSRFTTWAYKFAILHTAAEMRRASWRHAETGLAALGEAVSTLPSADQYAEGSDLSRAVRAALDSELTAHQRAVAIALLVENVPIDVLAERLGTTRNALYKTLHDARKRLRADLARRGYLTGTAISKEVTS
ncbi:MAG: RNA polymerase sigma factor [Streptosporangiaceae bacterium]